jgi:RNA polymerase sigma-70 factor (ECF subfamily)
MGEDAGKDGESLEDSRIIELFFERSEQAIAELSEKYGRVCLRIADNILNNRLDAEECVNDAWLAVWDSIPPERPEPLISYVSRIVRNIALKRYQRNTAQKRNSFYDVALDEIADCIPASVSDGDEIAEAELAKAIDRFIGTLDRQSRIMFVRRYWRGDSVGDIASAFKKSRHYVSVRLSRVRKSLRQHLTGEGYLL